MIKVFVAIPTTGTVCDVQAYSLREMEKKYASEITFTYPQVCVRRIFHDFARCGLVEEFLQTDCDVLWFLDSDVAPQSSLWDKYLAYYEEWELAAAPYPLFIGQHSADGPQIVYGIYNGMDKGGFRPSDIPREGIAFVDGAATGCMMIKRHILEGMQKPYFEFKYNPETRDMTEGEDLGFCKKMYEAGHKFFVDYAQVCKHYKNVCLRDVNDYAMQYAKRQVEAYDALARKQIEDTRARLKQAKAARVIAPSATELKQFR